MSARGQDQAVARELKFLVRVVNGWQTAYGCPGGELLDGEVARRAS